MKNIKKYLSIVLILTMCLGVLSGCNDNQEVYDNYSRGLTENGIYENIEQYEIKIPDYKNLKVTCDELLQWGVELMKESGYEDINTIDDYVYSYGEEFLFGLGVTDKDIVAEGDIVSASLEFYVDGKKLNNFTSDLDTVALSDGDSIVVSLIGHKVNDEYETSYTFPENDKDFANKTATVKVVIKKVVSGSPIEEGMVESNLEKIGEYLDNVNDAESFLKELRPEIAKSILPEYVKSWVLEQEWDIPEEFVDYEMYRLKFRLNRIGYTYEEYLKEVKMTDEENREYCRMLAKENVFAMMVYQNLDKEITDKDLADYYGDNKDYLQQAQGRPYLCLGVMRALVWNSIPSDVQIEGVPLKPDNITENVDQIQPPVDDVQ